MVFSTWYSRKSYSNATHQYIRTKMKANYGIPDATSYIRLEVPIVLDSNTIEL